MSSFNDAMSRAQRAQALHGSPRRHVQSRKYAVATTPAVAVTIPTWLDPRSGKNVRPGYVRIITPTAAAPLHLAFDRAAVAPTTGAAAESEPLTSDETIALDTQSYLSIIAEGSGDAIVCFYWT